MTNVCKWVLRGLESAKRGPDLFVRFSAPKMPVFLLNFISKPH